MQPRFLTLAAACIATSSAVFAQRYVLMPDSTADKIVKFDASTGAVLDANFILDSAGVLFDFSTPKDAIQVNNEIWVLDQVSNQLVRFDQNGTHVATVFPATGMLSNIRGGCFANNTVYVTNDGTANGATGDTVVMFDTAGTRLGQFTVANTGTSPFDVTEYNGELLVCHFTSTNTTGRYDYAGNLLGTFHTSNGTTGIDSPEQISITAANTALMSGFAAPLAVYEYDAAGTQINSYPFATALRGVVELDSGLLLVSTTSNVGTYDRNTNTYTIVYTSTGCQFINVFDFGSSGPVTYCTAGVSTNGCVPAISGSGTPSVAASSGFTISVANVEGAKLGLLFYGINGRASSNWGSGGTSFLCVKTPTQRMGSANSGGTAGLCDGTISEDWLAYIAAHPGALGAPFSAGAVVNAQGWYRDPPAVKTTNLSDGLEFTLVP